MKIFVNGKVEDMSREQAIRKFENRYGPNGELIYDSRHDLRFEKDSNGEEFGIAAVREHVTEPIRHVEYWRP